MRLTLPVITREKKKEGIRYIFFDIKPTRKKETKIKKIKRTHENKADSPTPTPIQKSGDPLHTHIKNKADSN